jgi:hypothetical protein
MSPAASIGPSATDRERSLTRVRDAGAARSSYEGHQCDRAATGHSAQESAPRSRAGLMPRLLPENGRDVSELPAQRAAAMSMRSGRGDRRPALSGARDKALAMAERTRVRARTRPAERRDDRAEIRCRSRPVVFELSVLWPDDHAKGPPPDHQAVPTVSGTHQHDGRAVRLAAARGCALRRRLVTQRRRCPGASSDSPSHNED